MSMFQSWTCLGSLRKIQAALSPRQSYKALSTWAGVTIRVSSLISSRLYTVRSSQYLRDGIVDYFIGTDDPVSWGYHPLGGHKSFIPDHRSHDPPFELALVGAGTIEIPEELAYVVTVYHDLDYEDFYKLVAGMDIVVPAFADFGCE